MVTSRSTRRVGPFGGMMVPRKADTEVGQMDWAMIRRIVVGLLIMVALMALFYWVVSMAQGHAGS